MTPLDLSSRLDFMAPATWPRLGTGLLALGILVAAAQAVHTQGLQQQLARQRADLAAMVNRQMPRPSEPGPQEQRRHLQLQVITDHLAAPWSALLDVVERTTGKHVQLRSFEPDAASGQLRLSARARDLPAMLEFVAALEAQPEWRQVVLQSSELSQAENTGADTTDFVLTAQWRQAPAASAASGPSVAASGLQP